jgi:hypothetical protein
MPATRHHFTASRVYNRLYHWARNTSSFADSVISGWDRGEPEAATTGRMIYRLRRWPELPTAYRTAAIYRILSVMSSRPVNRHWILTSSRIAPRQLDGLLRGLIANGAVEAIDPTQYA